MKVLKSLTTQAMAGHTDSPCLLLPWGKKPALGLVTPLFLDVLW